VVSEDVSRQARLLAEITGCESEQSLERSDFDFGASTISVISPDEYRNTYGEQAVRMQDYSDYIGAVTIECSSAAYFQSAANPQGWWSFDKIGRRYRYVNREFSILFDFV